MSDTAMTPERLFEITERVERRFGAFIRADALDLIAEIRALCEKEGRYDMPEK